MTDDKKVDESALRAAIRKIVRHAHAPLGTGDRLSKQELMELIDVIDDAEQDSEWTVYYP